MREAMKNKTTHPMTRKRISEGLKFEDLKGLVDSMIVIDLYKPKIGDVEDTVVVAFNVTYEDPAKDLADFIETSTVEHLDVEVAGAPDANGVWKVFVEFQRDHNLFEKIQEMLNNVDQITSRDEGQWMYRAFRVKKEVEFNEQNFRRDIVDSRYEYRKKFLRNEEPEQPDELEESWLRRLRELQKLNA